ncbi:MAG TPA: hypothetical protein VIJ30_04405 [Candidatus Dormibacteraeota bacterium]
MKRPILIAAAAGAYLVAAWMVAPGFYDGIAPQQPYNWVCPPPIAGANSGVAAASGHLVIKVIDGTSDANSAFTDDGQVIVSFLPGAFQAAGNTQVTVDIKPVSPCPNPSDLHFSTNVYLITADASLVQNTNGASPCQPACIGMRYSTLIPAPSFIYRSADANGPWTNIGGSENQQFVIRANTNQLGYFAGGYPANATNKSSGTSQLLPIAVAVLIIGVLLAGIPLAMVRRRRAGAEADEEDDEGDDDEERSTPRT